LIEHWWGWWDPPFSWLPAQPSLHSFFI